MPLVSCVLVTRNRPGFLRQAITYYERQCLESSELIVVDDSDPEIAPPAIVNSSIHYVRLAASAPLGTKLNIGIQHASGAVIQKLDDDDYYHPRFLRRASEALLNDGRSDVIVASGNFLVLVIGHRRLYDAGGGWFVGATLSFPRRLWEARPFRDVPYREDNYFLEDHAAAARVRLDDPELFVAVRHGGNNWNALVPEPSVPALDGSVGEVTEFFRRRPAYHRSIEDVMGRDNAGYYQQLAASLPSRERRELAQAVHVTA